MPRPESNGKRLISELLAHPQRFVEEGSPYALLQEYWAGFSLSTLRELLRASDPWIQRAAGFVASELGSEARGLETEVLGLLSSSDLHAQNYAMEVLSVVSEGANAQLFAHVVRKLESPEPGIRRQAMELVARAAGSQLEAAARVFRDSDASDERHERGLVTLAQTSIDAREIAGMLQDNDRVVRQYGAIGARRKSLSLGQLGIEADSISDPEIVQFIG
jgi:hypothetical protein